MQKDLNDIQETEKALSDIGIVDFDTVSQLLSKRREALNNIERERQNQFYNDATELYGLMQAPTREDRIVSIARYLRKFMEYGTSHALQLKDNTLPVKNIVDAMPQMSDK